MSPRPIDIQIGIISGFILFTFVSNLKHRFNLPRESDSPIFTPLLQHVSRTSDVYVTSIPLSSRSCTEPARHHV